MANASDQYAAALDAMAEGLSKRCRTSPTDFLIKCKELDWKVHRFVLTMHSPVFDVACHKHFKETDQGYIDLSEEDPKCIDMLYSYLYNLDYDQSYSDEIDFHVKMCILADEYQMKPLSDKATAYFKQSVDGIAMWHEEAGFCRAIQHAYNAPLATGEIRKHIVKLMVDNDILGYTNENPGCAFEATMREYGELTFDVASGLRARLPKDTVAQDEKRFKCPNCTAEFVANISSHREDASTYCYACGYNVRGRHWQRHTAHKE